MGNQFQLKIFYNGIPQVLQPPEGLGLKPRRTPTNFGFGSPSQARTRSTAVKALRATITQRDYESAPQRHTGTGLLFSSRVLRVLLKGIPPVLQFRTHARKLQTQRPIYFAFFSIPLFALSCHISSRTAPLGRTALAGGSLMGKSVLAVDARFSVCISLTPGYLIKPGLELSSFGALAFHGVRDYRQLPAKWQRYGESNSGFRIESAATLPLVDIAMLGTFTLFDWPISQLFLLFTEGEMLPKISVLFFLFLLSY